MIIIAYNFVQDNHWHSRYYYPIGKNIMSCLQHSVGNNVSSTRIDNRPLNSLAKNYRDTYFIHSSLIHVRHCSTTPQFSFILAMALSIFSSILGAKVSHVDRVMSEVQKPTS